MICTRKGSRELRQGQSNSINSCVVRGSHSGLSLLCWHCLRVLHQSDRPKQLAIGHHTLLRELCADAGGMGLQEHSLAIIKWYPLLHTACDVLSTRICLIISPILEMEVQTAFQLSGLMADIYSLCGNHSFAACLIRLSALYTYLHFSLLWLGSLSLSLPPRSGRPKEQISST